MKAIGIIFLIIGVAIIGYLAFVKKSVMEVTNDIIKIGTADAAQKAADKVAADKIVDGTTTPDPTKPPVVTVTPIATNKLGLTYQRGQSIYRTYNKTDAPYQAIGYLADGTLLTFLNCVYSDGEYKKVVNLNGVKGILIGNLIVDGSSQKVWSEREGYNLWNYLGAVGFLENGIMVFREIMNEGQYDEYSFYRT